MIQRIGIAQATTAAERIAESINRKGFSRQVISAFRNKKNLGRIIMKENGEFNRFGKKVIKGYRIFADIDKDIPNSGIWDLVQNTFDRLDRIREKSPISYVRERTKRFQPLKRQVAELKELGKLEQAKELAAVIKFIRRSLIKPVRLEAGRQLYI